MKLPRIMISTEKAKAALEKKKVELSEKLKIETTRDAAYDAAKKEWETAARKLMADPSVKVFEMDGTTHYDEHDDSYRAITVTFGVPADFPSEPAKPRRRDFENNPSHIEARIQEVDQLLRLLSLTEDASVPAAMLKNIAEFI